jgi:hypothetical protein
MLQSLIIIDRGPIFHLHRRLHSALRLLHHMPGLVGQVLLLSWTYIDLRALRVR